MSNIVNASLDEMGEELFIFNILIKMEFCLS